MTWTQATSKSTTVTEARVREVMKQVFDDLVGLALRGFTDFDTAQGWQEDLIWMLTNEVITSFEVQLRAPGRGPRAFRYDVSDDDSLYEASQSGGLQLYEFPDGTSADLIVRFRHPLDTALHEEVRGRGWTRSAAFLPGEGVRDRAYSHEGYGVIRKRVGDW